MEVHLAENAVGVFAFAEGKLQAFRIFGAGEAVGRLREVGRGSPTPQHLQLVEELVKRGWREFVVEEEELARRLKERFPGVSFRFEFPSSGGERLRREGERLVREVCGLELREKEREVALELAREEVGRRMAERDRTVIGASKLLEEVDKTLNLLVGLLREWYSLHFPELAEAVGDHERYARLLFSLGGRREFTEERLRELGFSPEEARRISSAAKNSLGAEMGEEDLEMVRRAAGVVLELFSLRERLAEYLDRKMEEVAPNLRAVVGGLLGARLLSLAGGLERLARMPSSTIQVLGAEKALFRALRSKGKPPKHGVIYRFPPLRSAPKRLRGKIARAVAGKVSIAARVDLLGGGYVGDRLSAELERRLREIRGKKG